MALVRPRESGPGNYNLGGDAKGKYVYLSEGRRFIFGHLPTANRSSSTGRRRPRSSTTPPPSEPKQPPYELRRLPERAATDIVPATYRCTSANLRRYAS